jgi:DNA-binding GntR family transcriptional regulator
MQQHFHTESLARQTIRDHAFILAALAAHDPDAARTAMRRHIGRVIREFQRGVNDSPAEKTADKSLSVKKRGARPVARA